MTTVIVLVNGVNDGSMPEERREMAQKTALAREFPEAKVLVLSSIGTQGWPSQNDYLPQKALSAIKMLQISINDKALVTEPVALEDNRIVFIAHNIGVALVKQILLLASEYVKYHWIMLQTAGLHFVESPSYTEVEPWRQFLFQLLSTDRVSGPGLVSDLDLLSKTLAHLEIQFSIISGSFDQKTYDKTAEGVCLLSQGIWDVSGGTNMSEDIIVDVRESLTKNIFIIFISDYDNRLSALSRTDVALHRLRPVLASPSPVAYLESHQSFNSWIDNTGSSILAVGGPPGFGHTYLASHIMRHLLFKYSSSRALFLSFSFQHYRGVWPDPEKSLVSSAIRQLLTLRPDRCNHDQYYILKSFSNGAAVSSQRLWDYLFVLLATITESSIFFIVDAADQSHKAIVTRLVNLATSRLISVPLKLVMTTSSSIETETSVPFYEISLEEDGWKQVVRDITAEKVSQLIAMRPVFKEFEQLLIKKISSRQYFNDIFAMTDLNILDHYHDSSIRRALQQYLSIPMLPIEAFYRTMSGLQGNGDTRARLALNWVFHAVRPLTAAELAVALTLGSVPEEGQVKKRLVFDTVAENVTCDLERNIGGSLGPGFQIVDGYVTLAHSTLYTYVEAHSHLLIPNFHEHIASRCVWYLTICWEREHDNPLGREGDNTLELAHVEAALAFHGYALRYWVDHYRFQKSSSSSLDDEVWDYLSLLADHPTAGYNYLDEWEKRGGLKIERRDIMNNVLLLAAQIGLDRIARDLLQAMEPNAPERVQRAIQIAAGAGNLEVLQELRQHFQHVDLALAACDAAEYGHAHILKYILENMDPLVIEALMSNQANPSPLLLAVSNGHTMVAKMLLARGCSLQVVDIYGNTAVHLASRRGDVDALRALRSAGPDDFKSAIETPNSQGTYPLHFTCLAGFTDAFEFVLGLSAKGLLQQSAGSGLGTPIGIATKQGYLPIVRELIRAGDGFVVSFLLSPIIYAARNGHLAILCCLVEELQRSRDDANKLERAAEQNGIEDALLGAIKNGHLEVVKFLMTKTAIGHIFCLQQAAEAGHLDVLKALVRNDTLSKDLCNEYQEILGVAIRENHVHIVRYVLQVVKPRWGDDTTLFHYAAQLGHEFCLREMLRTANLDTVRSKDLNERTPLEVATESGRLGAFEMLFKWENTHAGAGALLPERAAKVLMLAIKAPKPLMNIKLVSYLFDNGWSANLSSRNSTSPLHLAIEYHSDQNELIQLILDRGADLNARDELGDTPLHAAVSRGRTQTVRLLVKKGANPYVVNNRGLTPLHIATTAGKV